MSAAPKRAMTVRHELGGLCARIFWRSCPPSGLYYARCEACLVLSSGHPLRQFTDEVADEYVGFLDPWHGRGWDTEGDIGDVCQFPLLPEEGYCSRPNLLSRA